MSDPFLGEIRPFAGNIVPKDWALCDGRLLRIDHFSALYSILQTTYGGDGSDTFALPNLQGRAPMGWGSSPGLTPRTIGETGGSSSVALTATQLPAHRHGVVASPSSESAAGPGGNALGAAAIYAAPPYGEKMAEQAIGPSGGSQPHANMQPYLAVSYIIALQGIYPATR